MNIYEKLQSCRVQLQNTNLNKSGENKFAGYKYFELQDFLPKINELFLEYKLFNQISFTAELATLTITNIEKPDEIITFSSPMAEAKLKGCHDIQNLGAVETYQRRYLYVTALEIVEHDALDKSTGSETEKSESKIATLKAKWSSLAGSLDGFDDFYDKQLKAGYNENQMDVFLTKKLKNQEKQGA